MTDGLCHNTRQVKQNETFKEFKSLILTWGVQQLCDIISKQNILSER